MIELGKEMQLQDHMARIEEFMPKLDKRHGANVADHLGFNTLNKGELKFSDELEIGILKKGD